MFGIFKFSAGVVVGAGLAVGSMNYHVIRTADRFEFIPKKTANLQECYVDIRGWTFSDWTAHPDLVWALYKNNKQDLIPGSESEFASLKQLFENK